MSDLFDSLLIKRLPEVRGEYRERAELAGKTWFKTGGPAEMLFKPADTKDLAYFLKKKPAEVPMMVLGVGSNLLVRDGGVPGVVIRLGRSFAEAKVLDGQRIHAGAACLSLNLARVAQMEGVAGLEFLSGIPGTVGGALAMNGGAYGSDTASVLESVDVVTAEGEIRTIDPSELNYRYRHADLPKGWVFTGATFKGRKGDPDAIAARMQQITQSREETQPIREKTGGSTFKNPPGHKAWELVDAAGGRGYRIGDAQMSEKHCNFMINLGSATAEQLERLGETMRKRVKEKTGILLEWEIKRVGEAK